MLNRALSAALVALVLSGCASAPVAVSSSLPWLDREFDYQPALVSVMPEDIFRLDPELARKLSDRATLSAPTEQRLKRLLATIFGTDGRGFEYRSGHSTVAAETWSTRTGDCLSLTVLTYSVSRALGMSAQMQEVQTPAIFGRVGELDIVNQHVNVLFPRVRGNLFVEPETHDVVIDFEPDFRAPRRGTPLEEAGIVARFYNNVAVENMAEGKTTVAYAYFKAAILKDPAYVSPYGNLAVLYRRSGHEAQAEHLLKYAVSLDGPGEVALHELRRLYVDQGRVAEAREVDRRLEARRESDPYHWMGVGLKHLAANEPKRAIDALKHAAEIAPSFAEVHRYLAVAYARAGDSRRANEELAALTGMGTPADKLAMLRRKLEQLAQ
jgi:Tfp pilus assembly protein PilF